MHYHWGGRPRSKSRPKNYCRKDANHEKHPMPRHGTRTRCNPYWQIYGHRSISNKAGSRSRQLRREVKNEERQDRPCHSLFTAAVMPEPGKERRKMPGLLKTAGLKNRPSGIRTRILCRTHSTVKTGESTAARQIPYPSRCEGQERCLLSVMGRFSVALPGSVNTGLAISVLYAHATARTTPSLGQSIQRLLNSRIHSVWFLRSKNGNSLTLFLL